MERYIVLSLGKNYFNAKEEVNNFMKWKQWLIVYENINDEIISNIKIDNKKDAIFLLVFWITLILLPNIILLYVGYIYIWLIVFYIIASVLWLLMFFSWINIIIKIKKFYIDKDMYIKIKEDWYLNMRGFTYIKNKDEQ